MPTGTTSKAMHPELPLKPRSPGMGRRPYRASLPQLIRRTCRQLDLIDASTSLADPRDPRRRIPVSTVLLAVMTSFWLQLGSLHALEDRLARNVPLRRLFAETGWTAPLSEDTIAEVLDGLEWPALRSLLHHQGKRELAGWGAERYKRSVLARKLAGVGAAGLAGRAVVAVDGHELFSSEHRTCDDCQSRQVTRKRDGRKVTVTEYFHSAVFAQQIGAHPALTLDVEPIRPGENELFPAYRLLERMAPVYGRRVGIVVADGAFDGEPFRQRCRKASWHYVIRCKNKNQDPGKTAVAALDRRDPDRRRPDQTYVAPDGTRYECWEEAHHGWRYVACRRTRRTQVAEGACVTDLPAVQAPPVAVAMLMETRWSIENTGFREMVEAWDLDRAYVHAGRPCAVWAIVLLALLAYNAFQAYVYRDLGLDPAKPGRTLKALRVDFWESLGTARAPPLDG